MTQSVVTIDGLTKLANDLIIQNTALRNRLDAAETQRDELLAALILAKDMMLANNLYLPFTLEIIDDAIANAKEE